MPDKDRGSFEIGRNMFKNQFINKWNMDCVTFFDFIENFFPCLYFACVFLCNLWQDYRKTNYINKYLSL